MWGPVCNRSIVWLGSSVVECSHGKRDTLVRVPVGPHSFSARVTQYRTGDNYYEYKNESNCFNEIFECLLLTKSLYTSWACFRNKNASAVLTETTGEGS